MIGLLFMAGIAGRLVAMVILRAWVQKRFAQIKHTCKLVLLGGALVALSACGTAASSRGIDKSRQETAIAMWKERCQKAGEFIHETVEDVEGVYLMKTRESVNYADQFKLDDPYGHDSYHENLIKGFLRKDASPNEASYRATDGYRYVVAREDWGDGQLHRFTGSWLATRKKDVNSPWIQAELKKDPNFDLNVYDYKLHKAPPTPLPRYGVTWDDISTREEREYWIAGSSLKVIDLQTNKVIAERVGYMVDWAQGSRAGNRSPWLFAADTACPAFRDPSLPRVQPAFSALGGQTYRFVSKVLKPKQ